MCFKRRLERLRELSAHILNSVDPLGVEESGKIIRNAVPLASVPYGNLSNAIVETDDRDFLHRFRLSDEIFVQPLRLGLAVTVGSFFDLIVDNVVDVVFDEREQAGSGARSDLEYEEDTIARASDVLAVKIVCDIL